MRRLSGLIAGIALVAACQPAATGGTVPPIGGAPTGPPSLATTPAATTELTPAPTLPVAVPRAENIPTDGSCEDADSSCLGVLEPDKTYTSKIFKPTLTFKLPSAGWINQFDGAGDIGLQSLDPAGDTILFLRDPRSVDKAVGTKVEDIATWLSTYDKLTVTPFKPVKLGGLSGLVMDVSTSPTATGTGGDAECPVQVCVPYMRGDDPVLNDPYQWHWDWGTAGPEKNRLYLLADPDGTIAVVVDSLDGTTFDSLIATWEKIVPTIKFG